MERRDFVKLGVLAALGAGCSRRYESDSPAETYTDGFRVVTVLPDHFRVHDVTVEVAKRVADQNLVDMVAVEGFSGDFSSVRSDYHAHQSVIASIDERVSEIPFRHMGLVWLTHDDVILPSEEIRPIYANPQQGKAAWPFIVERVTDVPVVGVEVPGLWQQYVDSRVAQDLMLAYEWCAPGDAIGGDTMLGDLHENAQYLALRVADRINHIHNRHGLSSFPYSVIRDVRANNAGKQAVKHMEGWGAESVLLVLDSGLVSPYAGGASLERGFDEVGFTKLK